MNSDIWNKCPKPIIGLAPMDGYSDSAFRRICKEVNPSIITYTEFTSADGIHYNAKSVQRRLRFHPSERPVIAQIFGKNTDTFVTASKFCEDMGFAGIDLNMGCPAKKVVKSEHGVALRKNPDLACRLVEAVASAVSIPVSVKTRLGWENSEGLEDFGVRMENAGAKQLCIHGRTYTQPYKVAAQFDPIYRLKEAVSIPVLGNGGIISIQDGLDKLGNLDGFLIGQASFGNPWIFDPGLTPPTFIDKVPIIKKHARYLIEDKGEQVGCREIRKHLLTYVKDIPGARQYRNSLSTVSTIDEIDHSLDVIIASLIETVNG